VLPPVQAPSAGFLLQLFFIPLIIVTIIVAVWAMFSWLVHLGSDPQDLVRDIRKLNDASWQKAWTLSDMLRNPEYDALKKDVGLARELSQVLQQEIQAGEMAKQRIQLRVYLCRALGEFRVPVVVPALVEATRMERKPEELDVRRSAVESLAVLAGNLGHESLRQREDVMQALLEASRERGQTNDEDRARAELRSAAAFALGVIGGSQALDRLAIMLTDAHLNTRYNAATGLARHGDPRSQDVLIEMLDPDNEDAVREETSPRAREQKRNGVLIAAISATARLAEAPPDADLQPLLDALNRLAQADVGRGVRMHAQEAVYALQEKRALPSRTRQ
jgi:HEAT repeat protein